MVEAVEAPWWTDAEIADFARICTVTKFRRAMRSNLFGCDPDESDARARGPKDQLSFGINRHGRWTIRAELGVDDGRRVEAALAERKDALFDAGDTDVTWPEAFVDCFDRSLGASESNLTARSLPHLVPRRCDVGCDDEDRRLARTEGGA